MKTKLGKSIDIYHKILLKAWERLRTHKHLWFFGLFAALLHTGTVAWRVIEMVISVRPTGISTMSTQSDSFARILEYTGLIFTQNNVAPGLIALMLIVIGIGIFLLAIAGQQLLITGLHSKKRTLKEVSSAAKRMHVLQLFYVNALLYISLFILFIGSSSILNALLVEGSAANVFIYIGVYLVLIPLAFWINMVGMLALIDVVRTNAKAWKALQRSATMIRTHLLASLEMALGLFSANLFFSLIAACIAVILVVVPSAFAAFIAGSAATAASIILIVAGSAIILLTISYAAFITVFSYAVWYEFWKKMEGKGLNPMIRQFINSWKK